MKSNNFCEVVIYVNMYICVSGDPGWGISSACYMIHSCLQSWFLTVELLIINYNY